MSDQIIQAIIQVCGTLTAVIVFLTSKKKQDNVMHTKRTEDALSLEATRHKNQMEENTKFTTEINNLKIGIVKMNVKIEEFKTLMASSIEALGSAEKKYTETQTKADELIASYKDHKEWVQSKFGKIDAKHIEYDANFGKVIFREK